MASEESKLINQEPTNDNPASDEQESSQPAPQPQPATEQASAGDSRR